jgi:nitroreductase
MDVYEAVMSRRAVRGFTDQHVPREVLERVLSAAAWSPSGSNLQPWNSYVLTRSIHEDRPFFQPIIAAATRYSVRRDRCELLLAVQRVEC